MTLSDRNSIINLHLKGVKNTVIANALKISRVTVYRAVKRFLEMGDASDRQRSGRPRLVRTPEKIKSVRERIRRNPNRSIRKMANEFKMSEKSMRRLIKDDLKMKSLSFQKRQALSDTQKIKRFERSKILLKFLKKSKREVVWSDEKIFTVEKAFNKRNDRVICRNSKKISIDEKSVFRSMKPASVMVWAAVSETWKSPLIFVEKKTKINSDVYIEQILKPAISEMMFHFRDKPFTYQQDGATSHTSNKTQKWMRENVPSFWHKEMWPPCSPDLNPMDFSVWNLLEKEACKTPHKSIGGLKRSLLKAWDKIPQKSLRAICMSVNGRLEKVIENLGGHFE